MTATTRESSLGLFRQILSNSTIRGYPDFDPNLLLKPEVVQIYSPNFKPLPDCNKAYAYPSVQSSRDLCVNELLGMIDISYHLYRRALIDGVNGGNLVADMLTLGFGTATALVPGATTKAIFGGVIAGINGTKSDVNADVLYNSSIVVITNQMDSDRAAALDTILTRMKSPPPPGANNLPVPSTISLTTTIDVGQSGTGTPQTKSTTTKTTPDPPKTYTIADASLDLIVYYEAGSFTHALQSLQAKTGKTAKDCKQQVTNNKTGTTNTSTTVTDTTTTKPTRSRGHPNDDNHNNDWFRNDRFGIE